MNTAAPVRRIVFGVMGHVDHGKTALVRALTGMETDRLAEEQRRGISIALGFAHFDSGSAGVDLIDMPGHERFVRTMVAGASGIQAALLVVAANEGVMPQTLEHLDIAGALDVRRAVLAVTKADLVDKGRVAMVDHATREAAQARGIDIVSVHAVCATDGSGIEALRSAVAALSVEKPAESDGFFYLPVDRVFSLQGHGTVVTGTLRRGRIAALDKVEIAGTGVCARIRLLHVHGQRLDAAEPGQRVAVNLRDLHPSQFARGAALCSPGVLNETADWLTAAIRLAPGVSALAAGTTLRLFAGTAEIGVRLRLLDRPVLEPGEAAIVQLCCVTKAVLPAREHFVLRRPSPPLTLGGGRILDPVAARHRRGDTRWLADMAELATGDAAEFAAHALRQAGMTGLPRSRLARLTGVAPALLTHIAPSAVTLGDTIVVATAIDNAVIELERRVAAQPDGVARETLAQSLPALGADVFQGALTRLVASGRVIEERGRIRRFDAAREADRAKTFKAAAAQLAEAIRKGALAPPNVATVETKPVLDGLVRAGILVRATDRVQRREILFHRDAVDFAKRRLADGLARSAGLSVSQIAATLGISRKYAVPLVEYLDSVGYTRRVDDLRRLKS